VRAGRCSNPCCPGRTAGTPGATTARSLTAFSRCCHRRAPAACPGAMSLSGRPLADPLRPVRALDPRWYVGPAAGGAAGRDDRRGEIDRDLWRVDGTSIRALEAAAGAQKSHGAGEAEPADHGLGRTGVTSALSSTWPPTAAASTAPSGSPPAASMSAKSASSSLTPSRSAAPRATAAPPEVGRRRQGLLDAPESRLVPAPPRARGRPRAHRL
jgi:hypothetical protein